LDGDSFHLVGVAFIGHPLTLVPCHIAVCGGTVMCIVSRRMLLFGTGSKPLHHDGVMVSKVQQFSCAETGGLKPGDILMEIDGNPISESGECTFRNHERVDSSYLIVSKKVGDTVKLKVLRGKHSPAKSTGNFDVNKLVSSPCTPEPIELQMMLTPPYGDRFASGW
jgi:hypothetical protein